MKKIVAFDKWLFFKINGTAGNSAWDTIMLFIRNPFFWAPLYIFLIVVVFEQWGKKAFAWLIFFLVNVSFTDFISSHVIKPWVARSRPCGDESMAGQVKLIASYCGGNGSFTSSHASNHFGIAMFIFITLGFIDNKWKYLFFIWAAAICYAQVYVGVHYPSDVIGGAILGCIIGWITGNIFNKNTGILPKNFKV